MISSITNTSAPAVNQGLNSHNIKESEGSGFAAALTRNRVETPGPPSSSRRLAAELPELFLPTASTIRELSAELKAGLGTIFRRNGIAASPPVELDIDEKTMEIRIAGNRPDADTINALLSDNPDLARRIRTVAALSSHSYHMPEHLRFQREYRASANPAAVVAKYHHLFSGHKKADDFSMRFDGSLRLSFNGEEWHPAEMQSFGIRG